MIFQVGSQDGIEPHCYAFGLCMENAEGLLGMFAHVKGPLILKLLCQHLYLYKAFEMKSTNLFLFIRERHQVSGIVGYPDVERSQFSAGCAFTGRIAIGRTDDLIASDGGWRLKRLHKDRWRFWEFSADRPLRCRTFPGAIPSDRERPGGGSS